MKWIGQHIYDLIARYRSDVYLDDISTGTIDSGAHLGLDSNNKIVKAAVSSGGISHDGSTANGVLTYKDADEATVEANLTFDGSTLSVEADSNTTANALFIDMNSSTTGKGIFLDVDDAVTATKSQSLVEIDYDKSGVTAASANHIVYGHTVSLVDSATNHASSNVSLVGIGMTVDSASTSGNNTNKGIDMTVTDATTNVGIELNVENGGTDIKMKSTADSADYCTIATTTNAATTIATVDGDSSLANLTLDLDGNFFIHTSHGRSRFFKQGNEDYFLSIDVGDSGDTKFTTYAHAGDTAHFEIEADGDITLDAAGQIKLEPGVSVLWDSVALTGIQTSSESFADNDISLMTSAAIADKIEAYGYTTATGDITGVRITADDTNIASAASGSADFTIAGGTGASTAVSGTTLTVNVATASDSIKGVVELATTGEADTGTDTSRAVTPAGLKSHVDTRFTYQYISFHGNSDIATNWATPSVNGPIAQNWNNDTGESGTSVGSTTVELARSRSIGGWTVPFDNCVLVGFYGMIRNDNNSNQGALGLWHAGFSEFGGATPTGTFTLQAYAQGVYTGGAGSSYKGNCKAVDLARSLDLTAGDLIVPSVLEATADKVFFNITMVIKTPII